MLLEHVKQVNAVLALPLCVHQMAFWFYAVYGSTLILVTHSELHFVHLQHPGSWVHVERRVGTWGLANQP